MSEQLDVAVEATGESVAEVITEAPDHTPEPEADTDAVLEPAPGEAEESVETESEPEEVSPDAEIDFSDLTPNFIPADDVIDKLRIPKEDRATLKETAKIAREYSAKVDEFGGDFAMNSLKPLGNLMSKASATDDEVTETLNTLISANPGISMQIAYEFADSVFTSEQAFDKIFGARLGDNATLKNIKTLLALDKEGLVEKDPEYLGFEPTRVNELQTQVAELKQQLEAQNAPVVDKRADRAVKDFEDDVHPEISKKLEGVFARVSWDADDARTKLVTELVTARMKADPNYANIIDFLKTTGTYRNGENRHGVAEANLQVIRNKALGQATELVRLIQAATRKQSDSSRNRILEAKRTAPPKEIIPQPLPDTTLSFQERQQKAREAFIASQKV